MMRITSIVIIFLCLGSNTFAQFQINNDAVALGGNVYRLTQDIHNQAGSIWYMLQHDLTQPFSVQGQMYFGTDDAGADGIAFVMQNNCLAAGSAGGGIGYFGMPGQSIAIEFDTYENTAATGAFENFDPVYDHVAVMRSGVVNHGDVANNLLGPMQMHATKADVEDGLWYDFQITYDPASHELRLFFDNALRFSFSYDILNNIFGGNPYIYWGFTSSTGGFHNEQSVYINADLSTFTLSDAIICPGESVTVNLPPLDLYNGQNLAVGKVGVASTGNANEAIDGNMGSRWESIHGSDPEWMYVDLGSIHDLDSVILRWEAAYAATYQLQVSDDGIAWTTVHDETDPNRLNGMAPNFNDTIVFSAANVRYVRMYGTTRITVYGYSIWEFQIYGTPKYIWSPDDGSIDDVHSANPTFTPAVTTTYTVIYPDPCSGAIAYDMTITVDCSLPVTLLSFDVKHQNGSAYLRWHTAQELNSSHFTVLKSLNGIDFYALGTVSAAGNSNHIKQYNFTDHDLPENGTVYYQLIMTDKDGSWEKSAVKSISLKHSNTLWLLNSVFEHQTSLMTSGEFKWLHLTIVDVLGRVFYEHRTEATQTPIVLGETLPPATSFYLLIVETDTGQEVFKIMKIK